MSADRETTRIVRSWLEEGVTELPDRILDAVVDQLPATPQRRATWWPAGRTSTMNKFVTIGLAAAAVLVLVFVGAQLMGSRRGPGGPGDASPTPTSTATPTAAQSAPPVLPEAGVPQGEYVVTGADDAVQVTFDIGSAGWIPLPEFDALTKDDDGLDPPDSVGAALLAWGWPAGTGINVYGDPCQWLTTSPETPAMTPDDIAAAFAAQAETNPTASTDVTVNGFAGKAITLHVPMSYDLPNATREEKFAACDEDAFAFYGVGGEAGHARNAQGAGQIDELWILDVNGAIVILDATYSPATPPALVEELRTMAESATFEAP